MVACRCSVVLTGNYHRYSVTGWSLSTIPVHTSTVARTGAVGRAGYLASATNVRNINNSSDGNIRTRHSVAMRSVYKIHFSRLSGQRDMSFVLHSPNAEEREDYQEYYRLRTLAGLARRERARRRGRGRGMEPRVGMTTANERGEAGEVGGNGNGVEVRDAGSEHDRGREDGGRNAIVAASIAAANNNATTRHSAEFANEIFTTAANSEVTGRQYTIDEALVQQSHRTNENDIEIESRTEASDPRQHRYHSLRHQDLSNLHAERQSRNIRPRIVMTSRQHSFVHTPIAGPSSGVEQITVEGDYFSSAGAGIGAGAANGFFDFDIVGSLDGVGLDDGQDMVP